LRAWKKSRRTKKFYYFAIFNNELLIVKNRRISQAYCLIQALEELSITSGNGYAKATHNAGSPF